MAIHVDQTGRNIELPLPPKRIISLVPSQTELLHSLGLDTEVVGITKFCIHPHTWFRSKTRVGGTKNINPEIIRSLQPDLIIANKEENDKDQIEQLMHDYPVWISDINDLPAALDMIRSVGTICNRQTPSIQLCSLIEEQFAELTTTPSIDGVAYLIWNQPYMTVGGDTFINAMLTAAGFSNIFRNQSRYPVITLDDLKGNTGLPECTTLLLSSEPFPFSNKHVNELQQLLPSTRIIIVDGEMFSWYGSRLVKAPSYFSKLRDQFPGPSPFESPIPGSVFQ